MFSVMYSAVKGAPCGAAAFAAQLIADHWPSEEGQ
jgi:hypothetical protein